MLKITIICVGKLKEKFYTEASAEYLKRLQRYSQTQIIELPETRLPEEPSDAEKQKALAQEAVLIREKIPKGSAVIAMAIEGKTCSSEQLSQRLSEFAVSGKNSIVFLIGGSFGLDPTLKNEADWKLSMSPMTFPHHMARVMLLEQIYRSFQIQAGTKYHK